MVLVLDTNIFCNDFHLKSTNFNLLLDNLPVISAELYIPEVVVDETIKKHKEHVEKEITPLFSLNKKLTKYLDIPSIINYQKEELQKITNMFPALFKGKLSSYHTKYIPYPNVSHKDILKRKFSGKKPFKPDGRGYRDYLIWCSILDLLKSNPEEELVFITNNKEDFGRGRLYEDLIKDLKNINFNMDTFNLYHDIWSFNNSLIVPKLKKLDKVREQIISENFETFNIRKWIFSELIDEIDTDWIKSQVFNIDHSSSLSIGLNQINTIEIIDSYYVSENEIMLDLKTEIDVDLDLSVDIQDYTYDERVRNLVGYDPDFGSATITEGNNLDIIFILKIDLISKTIIEFEIMSEDAHYIGA